VSKTRRSCLATPSPHSGSDAGPCPTGGGRLPSHPLPPWGRAGPPRDPVPPRSPPAAWPTSARPAAPSPEALPPSPPQISRPGGSHQPKRALLSNGRVAGGVRGQPEPPFSGFPDGFPGRWPTGSRRRKPRHSAGECGKLVGSRSDMWRECSSMWPERRLDDVINGRKSAWRRGVTSQSSLLLCNRGYFARGR
jgi:hypothetical protein